MEKRNEPRTKKLNEVFTKVFYKRPKLNRYLYVTLLRKFCAAVLLAKPKFEYIVTDK